MMKRLAATTAKDTTACIIKRLRGALVAAFASGSMFEVPNSNIALPMKIIRGKILMVYAALSALRCS
jgi:hypothetical protein